MNGYKMGNSISIKKLAELADVSVATVSRVINQKGGYSAEVEQRIQKLIEEYHYTPNMLARGLQKSKASVIGILVPDIVNEHFAKIVLELEKEFFQNGYLTMICNTNESPELEKRHLQAMVGQNVSGIVLFSGREEKVDMMGIPTVYVNRRPRNAEESECAVFIESDNENGGYLAASELIEKECDEIYFLTDTLHESSKYSRYQGYRKAILENRISQELEEEYGLILTEDETEEKISPQIELWIEKSGLREKNKIGKHYGIVCATDSEAIAVIDALEKRKIVVPSQVMVTGYDDVRMAKNFRIPLTTVHQPTGKMAREAAKQMLKLIAGEPVKKKIFKVPVELIRRNSTTEN